MTWLLTIAGWCALAAAAGALLGRGIRLADKAQEDTATYDDELCALMQSESWPQAAVDEEFAQITRQCATDVRWQQ